MMRKINYLKAIVIVHGKSEKQICDYIKSNLRIKIEIYGDKKGEKSIQINGLMNILNNTVFNKFDYFYRKYNDIELAGKKIDSKFKIFIIMDTDDCNDFQKDQFISKKMFKKHWLYDYIQPIYNSGNLEEVLEKAGIKFEKTGNDRKKEYLKIFPTSSKYRGKEQIDLKEFAKKLTKVKTTNLEDFIFFCLEKMRL